MKKILLVKTSSLGDVVHNFPAVSDIARRFPGACIDWVVEEAYASLVASHRAVRRPIPVAVRRWRRKVLGSGTWREVAEWRRVVGAERYDAIIDTQGLLKSAIIARAAHGTRYGLDWRSSREPLRSFYDRTFSVSWDLHAVERNRRLCALALGYEPTGAPAYGIRCEPSRAAWLPQRPFLVVLHATSHPRKLWWEEAWIELGREAHAAGFALVLPWGAESERERSVRLAHRLPRGAAVVPARLGLGELAGILAAAAGVLGVDTGLTHLAAALGVPTVGIYGATDPQATGLYTPGPALNLGSRTGFPRAEEVWEALCRLGVASLRASTRLGA